MGNLQRKQFCSMLYLKSYHYSIKKAHKSNSTLFTKSLEGLKPMADAARASETTGAYWAAVTPAGIFGGRKLIKELLSVMKISFWSRLLW